MELSRVEESCEELDLEAPPELIELSRVEEICAELDLDVPTELKETNPSATTASGMLPTGWWFLLRFLRAAGAKQGPEQTRNGVRNYVLNYWAVVNRRKQQAALAESSPEVRG